MQLVFIIIGSMLLIALTSYFIYKIVFKISNAISPATLMGKEVFIVKVFGRNLLGQGQLINGYVYALPDQINSAIGNGLRTSLSAGDLILYTTVNENPSSLPTAMIAEGQEFSTSTPITFVAQPPNNNQQSGQYWVCMYGYKPIAQYDTWWRLFAHDQDSPILPQNYSGIQAFNSLVWNNPTINGSSAGNETFWCSFDTAISSPSVLNNFLIRGYSLAAVDQYMWSYSRGLGDQWQQSFTWQVGSSLSPSFETRVSVLTGDWTVPNMLPCVNCSTFDKYKPGVKMYAIWGNKAKALAAGSKIGQGVSTVIYDFNSTNKSQY